MAFFRNTAVNRVYLHSTIHALAHNGGSIFLLVFLIRSGVSIPVALLAQAAIMAGRFALRPTILPLAKRWGIKPLLIAGTLIMALQYPILAEVRGADAMLLALVVAIAIAEILYWPCYNAYFAAIGDAEHRGHQVSAREAFSAVAGIAAPLMGAWALLSFGPRPMFAAVGLIQAAAALPLIGAPNVAVREQAPGAFSAARIGIALSASDGWFDSWFLIVWQIALYLSLGESVAAYGGAMALAAVVGAALGLLLGRHIDAGHGRRAVAMAYSVVVGVVLLRSASGGSPWLAVAANALGPLMFALLSPALGTAIYNLAKASPCPIRFLIATEAGWDTGCFTACLLGAGLAAVGVPLALTLLLALPAALGQAMILRGYYARAAVAPVPGATT